MKKLSEINELWSKGLLRNKTGEKRLENKTQLDELCELLGKYVSNKLNIKYDKKICTYEHVSTFKTDTFTTIWIHLPVYHDLQQEYFITTHNFNSVYMEHYSKNDIFRCFIKDIHAFLNNMQYHQFNNMLSKDMFDKIKKILFDFVDDMNSKYELNVDFK